MPSSRPHVPEDIDPEEFRARLVALADAVERATAGFAALAVAGRHLEAALADYPGWARPDGVVPR